jgi:hypothetical protein
MRTHKEEEEEAEEEEAEEEEEEEEEEGSTYTKIVRQRLIGTVSRGLEREQNARRQACKRVQKIQAPCLQGGRVGW